MLKDAKEYKISYLKRGKFLRLIEKSGLFKIIRSGIEQDIYVADLGERHPNVFGHDIPIASINLHSMKPLNLDEPAFKCYHDKIMELYKEAFGS